MHFARGGDTADQVPLERLVGDAVVVDVSESALADRDYLITKADLRSWEKRNGRISRGSIVLLRTGFGRYWPDAERYLGTAERGPMRYRCSTSPVWARTVPVGWSTAATSRRWVSTRRASTAASRPTS